MDKEKNRTYRYGEVYYIFPRDVEVGNECRGGRPAVVVSNDVLNETGSVLEICYFTQNLRKQMPTHADVKTEKVNGRVLCEQVHSVSIDRVGKYIDTLTELDMLKVKQALRVSLNL